MAARERWDSRLQILRPVGIAAALAFALDVFLSRPSTLQFVAFAAAYAVSVAIFVAIGRWLGKRSWPRHGMRLARAMLRRRVRDERHVLFLSDRPDASRTLLQRSWEVFGFAAGASLLITTLLGLLAIPTLPLGTVAALIPLLMVYLSFLLVPYWLFARLGVRIVDPMRWLILPLSRRYADRLKLSNGVLVLLGAIASFNLAFRAGASGAEAVAGVLSYILRIAGVVIVIGSTAVAYYTREERRLAHELENEAVTMGIRDGRGMSDGDFLPRLPPSKS